MPLHLTTTDLERLGTAQRSLLSPLEHSTVDDWRSGVTRILNDLLGAEKAIFWIRGAEVPYYSDEHDPRAMAAYPAHYRQTDIGSKRRDAWKLEVWTRRILFPEGLQHLRRSECFHDFLRPNGIGDSMGLTVHDEPEQAGLYFHRERYGTDEFGERGIGMLRLLCPAFRAGVETWRRLGARRDELARMIDALPQALFLFDRDGGLLHRNLAAEALLAGDPDRSRLEQEVRRLGQSTGAEVAPIAPARRTLGTGAGRYRARATIVGTAVCGRESARIVSLERGSPALPDIGTLRTRYSLTRRQAEVALLLARRKTNREISEALFISPHTARHHTEAVLRTLGTRSRHKVRDIIVGAGPTQPDGPPL